MRRNRECTRIDARTRERIIQDFQSGASRGDLSRIYCIRKSAVAALLDDAGVSNSGINRLIDRQQGSCIQCGSTEHLTRDHIRPLSKGGNDNPRNIQIMCRPCNNRKADYWDGRSGWPPPARVHKKQVR